MWLWAFVAYSRENFTFLPLPLPLSLPLLFPSFYILGTGLMIATKQHSKHVANLLNNKVVF